MADFDEFLESLPEADKLQPVLIEFLNDVRQAVSLEDVNVAAGIAYQRLMA